MSVRFTAMSINYNANTLLVAGCTLPAKLYRTVLEVTMVVSTVAGTNSPIAAGKPVIGRSWCPTISSRPELTKKTSKAAAVSMLRIEFPQI